MPVFRYQNMYIKLVLLHMYVHMQSLDDEAGGAAVSEQLLMNTEQVGVLLVSTLNISNNETIKTISNPNIGEVNLCVILKLKVV